MHHSRLALQTTVLCQTLWCALKRLQPQQPGIRPVLLLMVTTALYTMLPRYCVIMHKCNE